VARARLADPGDGRAVADQRRGRGGAIWTGWQWRSTRPTARHASRYEAALRERNRLLAGEAEPDPHWLSSLEMQLAEAGAALAQGRHALVERLSAALAVLPEAPFARPLLAYGPGGPLASDALAAELGPPPRPRPRGAAHPDRPAPATSSR
jgi:hypothetical protein